MARFRRHILICENERAEGHPRGCCARKGGGELTAKFKEELRSRGLSTKFRANKSGCLDACEFGPVVVVYPDAIWYGGVTVEDVLEIIESHVIGGEPVQRLMIQDKRFLQEFG